MEMTYNEVTVMLKMTRSSIILCFVQCIEYGCGKVKEMKMHMTSGDLSCARGL